MSKYLPSEHFDIDFEGDRVSFDVEPIDQADFFKLIPFFQKNENGETKLKFDDSLKFMAMSGDLLGKYIKNFSGLKDSKGNDIALSVVPQKAYFMSLSQEMIAKLFEVSRLNGEEEKKSDGQSDAGLTESPSVTI